MLLCPWYDSVVKFHRIPTRYQVVQCVSYQVCCVDVESSRRDNGSAASTVKSGFGSVFDEVPPGANSRQINQKSVGQTRLARNH